MSQASFRHYKLSEPIVRAWIVSVMSSRPKYKARSFRLHWRKRTCGQIRTGSGKTAAFGIPICEMVDWEENSPQALLLTPTRELADQVKEDMINIGRLKRIKATALYGKQPFASRSWSCTRKPMLS